MKFNVVRLFAVGERPEGVRGENAGHLEALERGRAREPEATGEHRAAHRNVVPGRSQAFCARHQLCGQKRLQDTDVCGTRDQLRHARGVNPRGQNHKGTLIIILFG